MDPQETAALLEERDRWGNFMANNRVNLIGRQVGRLTVEAEGPRNSSGAKMWLCRCACGAEVSRWTSQITPNAKYEASCGCSRIGKRRTHGFGGEVRPPEYDVWRAMKRHCRNKNCKDYPNYGGRGIDFCERWERFENFYADMGSRPTEKHTLERNDNDLGYSPENCCWATRLEQSRNRRKYRTRSEVASHA